MRNGREWLEQGPGRGWRRYLPADEGVFAGPGAYQRYHRVHDGVQPDVAGEECGVRVGGGARGLGPEKERDRDRGEGG